MNTCLKQYLRYSFLNVLGMAGVSCYILADTFFVANGTGTNGLAALNIAIPVYSVIHGMGLMAGIGAATRFSIANGAGDKKERDSVFTRAIVLCLLFSAVFVTAGLFFADRLALLLGADDATFSMCRDYIRILMFFSPMFILNNIVGSFLRNDGAPGLSMAAMIAGSFANILMDWVFIFPLDMGVFGAALATGFSPMISLAVMSVFFIKKKNSFRLKKNSFSVSAYFRILYAGVPSLITELSSGIVMLVFNTIMLSLAGNEGVAAYGVIANIAIVVIAIHTGIAQGIQPLTATYYGAGRKKELSQTLAYAIITVFAVSILIYAVMFIFAAPVTALFNSESNSVLQEIAEKGIKIYFTGCLFAGINIVLASLFASSEKETYGTVISVLRGIAVIIPAAIIMSEILDITGLWLSYPVTELLTALAGCILLIISMKKQKTG